MPDIRRGRCNRLAMPRTEEARDAGRLQHETPDGPIGRVLRPGVEMPDWSAVTSATARRALEASFAVAGRHEKWAGLGDEEDRVWRAVLEGFASAGRAPDVVAVTAATGLGPAAVGAALDRLRVRDLGVGAEDTGARTAAYHFCDAPAGD